MASENIDVTEQSKKVNLGSLHPITQIIDEVEEIFLGMGYEIADGPEVEKAIYERRRRTTKLAYKIASDEEEFEVKIEELEGELNE